MAYKRWGHLGFLERGNIRKGGGGGEVDLEKGGYDFALMVDGG